MAMGLPDPKRFPFIEPPEEKSIEEAIQTLMVSASVLLLSVQLLSLSCNSQRFQLNILSLWTYGHLRVSIQKTVDDSWYKCKALIATYSREFQHVPTSLYCTISAVSIESILLMSDLEIYSRSRYRPHRNF